MSVPDPENPPRYVVVEGDRFEADRDRAILLANRVLGPDRAEEWRQALMRRLRELPDFPGPLSHARDEEASAFFGREVRRLFYYGPNRRSRQPARILFALTPPADDDPDGETVVLLLRLLRGGQSLLGSEDDARL